MMLNPTKREPANTRVESLDPAFAPKGKIVNVTIGEATALTALGRARMLDAEAPKSTAPTSTTETPKQQAEDPRGPRARAARPERGPYNRSDMQLPE